jgi:hypothetical protein
MKRIKTFLMALAVLGGLTWGAQAQTTNTVSTNQFPVISSIPSVQEFVEGLIPNPLVDYYSGATNEIEVGIGLSQNSQQSGTYQDTRLAYYHLVSSSISGGANLEMTALGVNGQDINQFLFGGQLRYGYHNVSLEGYLDGLRDFQTDRWGLEPGVGIEDGASPMLTFRLSFGPDIEPGAGSKTNLRTAFAATIRFW